MISEAIKMLWVFIRDITPGTFWEDFLLPPTQFLCGLLKDFGL